MPSLIDIEHSLHYASLVCKSPEAVERFIKLAEQMAADLLGPHGAILIVLSTVLPIRREEIDKIIADTVGMFELEAERAKRRQWQARVENASTLKSEKSPAAASEQSA